MTEAHRALVADLAARLAPVLGAASVFAPACPADAARHAQWHAASRSEQAVTYGRPDRCPACGGMLIECPDCTCYFCRECRGVQTRGDR
jgi:hypothetical protein